ncbi:MAG: protein-arginine deiminase [Deltaproteobacteria bacterium]|nr:MAG: protein-arginine deiminase [Deltaproteobacteria bacterium]
MTLTWWLAALALGGWAVVSCGSDDDVGDDDDGSSSSSSSSGVGGAAGCQPGIQQACYEGPIGTEGVGLCVGGLVTCLPDGQSWGPCEGQVLPTEEICATPGDDDCNGQTNEGGPDCACDPGTTIDCYSGPPVTEDVGICHGGQQICNSSGDGYGSCQGEVTPGAEDCATPQDEDCDGQTPPCTVGDPIIDIRADVNRNGVVDLSDSTEDANEQTWDGSHGAIFLANIDDDQSACSTSGTDAALAACNDGADTVVNGTSDLLDMARLETVPWTEAPGDASGSVTVAGAPSGMVRLFKNNNGTFQLYASGSTLSAAELQAGVELAIEATDFVRDDTLWDGYVTVTFDVDAGTGPNGPLPDGTDTVKLRVAPVLFRHHLDEAETLYATALNSTASVAFRNELSQAMTAAGVANPLYELSGISDQWTQDFFETAYMSMPAAGGAHVIHVNFRSANYTSGTLRSAGRVVFTDLRGPDVAGAVEYDPNHSDGMDSLNAFGNTETLPPHSYGGKSWPMGRVIRGSDPSYYPDQAFNLMIAAQGMDSSNGEGVQNLVLIDTSWLLVGHIDETFSYMPHGSGTHGWRVIVADTLAGWNGLVNAYNNGYGSTPMFVGQYWQGSVSAQTTIAAVVGDQDLADANNWALAEINDQKTALKAATGITDADFVSVPSVWWEQYNWIVAYVPGIANGIALSNDDYGAPEPYGPTINGQDLFKSQTEQNLSQLNITTRWIEDWDLYHRLDGEVHCGSNTTREIPNNANWWESAQ